MTGKTAYEAVNEKRNTLFSSMSGLPGYKPIFPVRVGYYLTFVFSIVGFIGFCVGFIWTAINFPSNPTILESFITLDSIPLSGVIFAGGWISMMAGGVLLSVTSRVSMAYEREYEDWVSEVVPENDAGRYPPQEYWEVVTGKEIDEPPVCGPRVLRDDTLSERVVDLVRKSIGWIFYSPFLLFFTFPQDTMQAPPMQNEIERESERSERRREY